MGFDIAYADPIRKLREKASTVGKHYKAMEVLDAKERKELKELAKSSTKMMAKNPDDMSVNDILHSLKPIAKKKAGVNKIKQMAKNSMKQGQRTLERAAKNPSRAVKTIKRDVNSQVESVKREVRHTLNHASPQNVVRKKINEGKHKLNHTADKLARNYYKGAKQAFLSSVRSRREKMFLESEFRKFEKEVLQKRIEFCTTDFALLLKKRFPDLPWEFSLNGLEGMVGGIPKEREAPTTAPAQEPQAATPKEEEAQPEAKQEDQTAEPSQPAAAKEETVAEAEEKTKEKPKKEPKTKQKKDSATESKEAAKVNEQVTSTNNAGEGNIGGAAGPESAVVAPAGDLGEESKEQEKETNKPVDKKKKATSKAAIKNGKAEDKVVAKSAQENKEKTVPQHTTPRTPEEDPDFIATQQRSKNTSEGQQAHEKSEDSAVAAQASAVVPVNEREGIAQATQVDELEEQEAGTFDAASFKAMLMDAIKAVLPTTEEEADDFSENNRMDEVKEQASGQVETEKHEAAGDIEAKAEEAPAIEQVPERVSEQLQPPAIGEAPANINAGQASPDARGEAEVSQPLQENVQEIDQTMAEARVTDEQLAKSNEPTFTGALDSKNNAETHAQEAPNQFRQQEQQVLGNSRSTAQSSGEQHVSGMYQQRSGMLTQVNSQQQATASKDTDTREKVANHINKLYERTKEEVEKILDKLDEEVKSKFDAAAAKATKAFEEFVERKMEAYKKERYGEWYDVTGWDERISDAFTGLPDEVNAFFTEGRELYISIMDAELTIIADFVAAQLNKAKEKIQQGKQEIQDYVVSLPEDLQQIGKDTASAIQEKFDALEESVNDKQQELVDSLANQYKESLQQVDARIGEMQEANKGLVGKALGAIQGVIGTIIQIKNMLMSLLSAAMDAVWVIIADPIGFLAKLLSGVKQGFQNFAGNIFNNLMGGMVEWLTGSLGGVGITIPDNLFSLSGIFSLVSQVLGLTWDYFRSKAVKVLGEPTVNAMEQGFEMFTIVRTQGIAGLWEHIKEQFTDLKEMVMDSIRDMVVTKVIEAGIKWIIGLMNPAGAFVKAAMMIIDIVRFFVERAAQIFDLVQSFIDSIRALASGDVSSVAKAIEKALIRSIPVLIGFLASLVGITGLAGKVKKIIEKVRKRIDGAIDKIINKAKKLFGKKRKPKKGEGKKIKEDNKKEKNAKADEEDKKKHKEIGDKVKKSLQATKGEGIVDLQKKTKKKGETLEDRYQPSLRKGINLDVQVESAEKAEKDGDVDVTVKIKPNDYEVTFGLSTKEENDDFAKILYKALEELGKEYYKGFTQEEYASSVNSNENVYSGAQRTSSRKYSANSDVVGNDRERLNKIIEKQESDKELERIPFAAHKSLAKIQIAYSAACKAEFYDNNVFSAYSTQFFVDQANNYYIYPNTKVKGGLYYERDGNNKGHTLEDINHNNDGSYLIGPSNPNDVRKRYDYGKSKNNKIGFLKGALKNIAQTGDPVIGSETELTLFIAAMMAEPSRYQTSYITHLLAILNPKNEKEDAYTESGKMSMPQGGSNPSGDKMEGEKAKKVDERLDFEGKKAPKIVTDKDLLSVKDNRKLKGQLKGIYKQNKGKMEDDKIKKMFKDQIEVHLQKAMYKLQK